LNQVWVAGEVLIDLLPDGDKQKAVVGGGPANTAVTLSKLGIKAQFINGISTDSYGKACRQYLEDAGVLLDFVNYSSKPTCTATVTLDKAGGASYSFLIDETSTFDYQLDQLPDPQKQAPALLHIGTLVCAIEPCASTLHQWVTGFKQSVPIVFDPNIRPSVIADRNLYLKQVLRWVSLSDVVKLSIDDLNWLYPGKSVDDVAKEFIGMGVELVVVTLGDAGIVAITKGEKIAVEAVKTKVVDTVGAGDTVGAILVEAIIKHGLEKLTGQLLTETLNRAAAAAAITISRAGANPPTQAELDQR
jgi:fructokinase